MTNNTNPELPVEVVEEIEADANRYVLKNKHFGEGSAAYIAGATSYATKLHQRDETIKILEYDNSRLKGELEGYKEAYDEVVKDRYRLSQENDEVMKNYNKLKEQSTGWRPLLEEFISMHETGLLPNRFTYEKAKKFINGE
jgi:FtsZ-binding cell division protein ZapB